MSRSPDKYLCHIAGATITKPKKLVITDLPEDHHQTFLNVADALELTRGQLLSLLMAAAQIIDGGLGASIPDRDAQDEWRDVGTPHI